MPARFSWVDQQFVQARHLDRLDVYACALYLFLITVADARGLSWYGEETIARRLSIDVVRLRQARSALVQADVLAFADGVYQVLSLGAGMTPPKAAVVSLLPPAPAPAPAPVPMSATSARPQISGTQQATPPVATERSTARQHLAALHAILEKRP